MVRATSAGVIVFAAAVAGFGPSAARAAGDGAQEQAEAQITAIRAVRDAEAAAVVAVRSAAGPGIGAAAGLPPRGRVGDERFSGGVVAVPANARAGRAPYIYEPPLNAPVEPALTAGQRAGTVIQTETVWRAGGIAANPNFGIVTLRPHGPGRHVHTPIRPEPPRGGGRSVERQGGPEPLDAFNRGHREAQMRFHQSLQTDLSGHRAADRAANLRVHSATLSPEGRERFEQRDRQRVQELHERERRARRSQ